MNILRRFLSPLLSFALLVSSVHSWAAEAWNPGYYMDLPSPACRPILANSPLASNPTISPYVLASVTAGWPIKECIYPFSTLGEGHPNDRFGWVVLADPPPAVLEQWIRFACEKKASSKAVACINALKAHVRAQNGGQFPVIGYVSEGGKTDSLCVQNGSPVPLTGLLAFQDGVTIQHRLSGADSKLAIYCMTENIDANRQSEWATSRPIGIVYNRIRLAGIHESCLEFSQSLRNRAISLGINVKLLASRENHLRAMQTGSDLFLEIQAERFAQGVLSLDNKC